MSKALPFTLGQAKRKERKHAQKTNENVKEIRREDILQFVKIFQSGGCRING